MKHVDLSYLTQLHAMKRAGQPSAATTIISIFLRNAPGAIKNIEESFSQKDPIRTSRLIHKFKSSCSSIGALALTSQLNKLEEMCEEITAGNSSIDSVRSGFEDVRGEYAQVSEILSCLEFKT